MNHPIQSVMYMKERLVERGGISRFFAARRRPAVVRRAMKRVYVNLTFIRTVLAREENDLARFRQWTLSEISGTLQLIEADLRLMAYRPDASDFHMAVMVVLADIIELIRKYSTSRVECTETRQMQYPMRCSLCGHEAVLVMTVSEYTSRLHRCPRHTETGCLGVMERYYPKDSAPHNSMDATPSKGNRLPI